MDKTWIKNTVFFLGSQTITLFGSSLVQYAIMWHITMQTQSGVMMTIAIICGFVPIFLLSPFAGVWADRYNRKAIIMLSDSLIAVSTLILAILFQLGYDMLWMLFVISTIRAFGSALQMPAVGAFLPQIVPGDKLTRVNSVNGSIQSLIMLMSPMLSAALLTVADLETIFFIDVITAALAVSVLYLFLHVPVHKRAQDKQTISYFTDMQEGLGYIKRHEYIKAFFLFCAGFLFLAAPAAFLTPLQVTRTFGNDVWRLSAIEITFSGGMILGGLLLAAWGGFKNKVHTMTLATLLFGVCTFALGVMPNFWIYLVFMGLTGVSMPFFNTPATVLLQEKVEENFLGRVFSVMGMISSTTMPLGMLLFGPLADFMRVEWLLIGTGSLIFFEGFFLLGSKALLEAGASGAEAK